MSTKPFFSVCIPTYNRAGFLPAAIDSVLAQDFRNYELVIVDNASTDNTQEVLEQYNDPRIRIFRNQETVSIYANHNKCIEHARAEWIVFLHSDEYFQLTALSAFAQAIREDLGDLAVIFPYSDRPVFRTLSNRPWWSMTIKFPATLVVTLNGYGPASGVCYRRQPLIGIGGFDASRECLYWGDLFTTIMLSLNEYRFSFINQPIEFRHEGSHRASYALEKTAAPEKAMSAVLKKLTVHSKWNEGMEFIENDIYYWPANRAARLLRIMAISGLHKEYRRLSEICRKRQDVLQSRDARIANFAYRISPAMFLTGLEFWRRSRACVR